jgi:hypothetical protein
MHHPLDPPDTQLDERKFAQETADKQRELDIREREVAVKERDQKTTRWSSPILIGVLAAIAGVTGSVVTFLNNNHNLALEKQRAQSTMLIDAIKTGDAEQACTNLLFLISSGFIEDKDGRIKHVCTIQDDAGIRFPYLPKSGIPKSAPSKSPATNR